MLENELSHFRASGLEQATDGTEGTEAAPKDGDATKKDDKSKDSGGDKKAEDKKPTEKKPAEKK